MSNTKWTNSAVIKELMGTGFNQAIALDNRNVMELSKLLVNPDFTINLFNKPSDWVTSLMWFPLNVDYGQSKYIDYELQLGIIDPIDTGVICSPIEVSLGWFDMGEQYISRRYYNFADYNGYTIIKIWLPYVGFVDVKPNDVMGKYLEFALSVDYNTGQCVYYIMTSDTPIQRIYDDTSDDFLWYSPCANELFADCRIVATHSGQMGYSIPLNSSNAFDMYRNLTMGAITAGLHVAGNGMKSSFQTSSGTNTYQYQGSNTNNVVTKNTERDGKNSKQNVTTTNNYSRNGSSTYNRESYRTFNKWSSIFDDTSQAISNFHATTNTENCNNPAVLCNGSNSIKIVIYRPKLVTSSPTQFSKLFGRPYGRMSLLSNLSGYVEISDVHIEQIGFNQCTKTELAMIEEALSSGIILEIEEETPDDASVL